MQGGGLEQFGYWNGRRRRAGGREGGREGGNGNVRTNKSRDNRASGKVCGGALPGRGLAFHVRAAAAATTVGHLGSLGPCGVDLGLARE
jgi:hypothetical protein